MVVGSRRSGRAGVELPELARRDRLQAVAAAMRRTLGAQHAAAANRHISGSESTWVGAPHRGMGYPGCVLAGARVPVVGGHDEESTVPHWLWQGSLTEVIRRLSCEDAALLRRRGESAATRYEAVKMVTGPPAGALWSGLTSKMIEAIAAYGRGCLAVRPPFSCGRTSIMAQWRSLTLGTNQYSCRLL
jgi:hypothetical protein